MESSKALIFITRISDVYITAVRKRSSFLKDRVWYQYLGHYSYLKRWTN